MCAKKKYRTSNDFLSYLKDNLSNKDRHDFERELEADPFEKEALQGLESISPGKAENALLSLHSSLRKRLGRRKRVAWYSIAATAASILIVGSIFLNIYDLNPADSLDEPLTEESFRSLDEPLTEESFHSLDEPLTEESLRSLDEPLTEESFRSLDEPLTEESFRSLDSETPEEKSASETLEEKSASETPSEMQVKQETPKERMSAPSPEPAPELAPKQTLEPAPSLAPTAELSTELASALEPDSEPIPAPSSDPVPAPSSDPVPKPITEPTPKPTPAPARAVAPGAEKENAGEQEAISVMEYDMEFAEAEVTKEEEAVAEIEAEAEAEPEKEIVMEEASPQKSRASRSKKAKSASYDELMVVALSAGEETPSYFPAEPLDGFKTFWIYIDEKMVFPDDYMPGEREVVLIRFTITKSGSLSRIKAIQTAGEPYTLEAIRLIREGPEWIPAISDNDSIDEQVELRIVFEK